MENIFHKLKEQVPAREVAEFYGLKVNRNGMACCPFHDDRHPSLKVDKNFYCFGCGARGDGVGYVALLFDLTQYEAARKIIEDFSIHIENESLLSPKEKRIKYRVEKEKAKEKARIERIYYRFDNWCNQNKEELDTCIEIIEKVKQRTRDYSVKELFSCKEYILCIMAEPIINYWLDILYMGTKDEKALLYLENRKEVEAYAKEIRTYDEGNTKCTRGDYEHESREYSTSDRRAG